MKAEDTITQKRREAHDKAKAGLKNAVMTSMGWVEGPTLGPHECVLTRIRNGGHPLPEIVRTPEDDNPLRNLLNSK